MNRDAGLQPERTNLAWHRTALSAAACSLLLVGVAARHGWGLATLPAVCTAGVSVTLVLLARRGQLTARPRVLLALAALVLGACVSAVPLVAGNGI
ncbi:protein of unknown function [Lentzea albidocapillata subsp. violacea]|uniref:DUF202 domain-containing protein n=1 Tax=Lentzea albidocapillata subsp. violacea TaxID=128104 RepID=A0A1H0A253_9PSEU|nr:protein of unknown function [Lentzea albidocapillata subsp. violacea]